MKIVAVSGMIGTGKTTLCDALSGLAGWQVVREDVSKNPFLALFYENMDRWALASQLRFMLNKTEQFERRAKQKPDVLLIDRTLHEDLYVFCSVLQKYEILSTAEFRLLKDAYRFLTPVWSTVNLTIYLEDSDENCFQRVLNRGDAFESKIELGYIKRVGEEYRKWVQKFLTGANFKICSSEIDFRKPSDVAGVLQTVKQLLGALPPRA